MVKFEYVGTDGAKDLDLALHKIMDPKDVLLKGTIIEVPDDNERLIRAMRINGNYKPVPTVHKVGRGRKRKRR